MEDTPMLNSQILGKAENAHCALHEVVDLAVGRLALHYADAALTFVIEHPMVTSKLNQIRRFQVASAGVVIGVPAVVWLHAQAASA